MPFFSLFFDVDLLDAEEWLLQADYASTRDKSERAVQKRTLVEELLTRVLPDVENVRIGHSKEDDYPTVEAKTPYGWVSVRNLSLGYQSMVAWMVDLASQFLDRFPDSKSPLSEPGIVLVDEIDLHMHPAWQRSLMSFLGERFPATQFIATAHSPLVVQGAEGADIVVLRREDDHVRIENSSDEIRNWRIDQILTSDLYGLPSARCPPRLDPLLAERRNILTNGDAVFSATSGSSALWKGKLDSFRGGESPDELRAMELIERAARKLAKSPKRKRK